MTTADQIGVTVPRNWWTAGGKRVVDVLLVGLVFVSLLPLLIVIGILIVAESPGSPFFVDERVGLRGHRFRMWKFRTMRPDAPAHALGRKLIIDDPRITRVGRVLRRLSLDELPQQIHILAGDMSVIGPRPGLWEQLAQYSEEQRERLLVRPGVTGLAQISGRNSLLWADRIRLDREYIRTLSMKSDVRILFLTVRTVVRGEGLYSVHQQRETL